MYSFVLQDWITIGGATSGQIIQSEQDWLDMSPFQDLVLWLDVREASTTSLAQISFETAPAKDEALFVSMGAAPITLVATSAPLYAPLIAQLLMGSAAVPIAQHLRWKVKGTGLGLWDATFRILVAANAPGLQPDDENRKRVMMGG